MMEAVARVLLLFFAGSIASLAASAASAQVAASVSVESDYRVRGWSVSDERPVASARFGFDDESGVYVDGSGSVVASRNDGLRFLGFQADAGFATQLGPLWSIDLGIAHDHFRAPYSGGPYYHRTEAYVGVTHGPISAYLFAAPKYERLRSATLYGQLEATIVPAPAWRLTAHAGALELLDPSARYSSLYDWRVGLTRELGRLEVHTALSGRVPGHEAARVGIRSQTALTAGASYSF